MSLFVLFIFSSLCRVFAVLNDSSNSNIINLIAEDYNCGFNENFTNALNLNKFCAQPILRSDEYRSKLNYDSSPLLCAEYYLVNSRLCNLTKSGTDNLKRVSIPSDKKDVDSFIKIIRTQYKGVHEFCNHTQKAVSAFPSLVTSTSDLKNVDDIFKGIVGNETICRRFCESMFDNTVKDMCTIIIWARTVQNGMTGSAAKDKSTTSTNESHIQVIDPNRNDYQDNKRISSEHVNSKKPEMTPPETLNEKPFETESDLRQSNETVLKISEKPLADTNPEVHQNLEKVINLSPGQYPEKNTGVKTNFGLNRFGDNENNEEDDVSKLPHIKKESYAPPNQIENKDNAKDGLADNKGNDDDININNEGTLNADNEGDDKPNGPDSSLPVNQEADEDIDDFPNQKSNQDLTNGDTLSRPSAYRDNRFGQNEDSHFFTYFVSMGVVCAVMYILFHNKKKILALAVEGRRGRPHGGGRRRPNTAAYSKLDSNLEEAMVSNVSQASVTHVLY